MNLEYFWETNYKFVEFLRKLFGDNFKRKYSLEGNGIYNLIFLNNNIYEVKYTQCKKALENDNHIIDNDKKYILDTIKENLKCKEEDIILNLGKIMTFPVGQWTAKIEIVKKLKEPN